MFLPLQLLALFVKCLYNVFCRVISDFYSIFLHVFCSAANGHKLSQSFDGLVSHQLKLCLNSKLARNRNAA